MNLAAGTERVTTPASSGRWLTRGRIFTFLGCYFFLQVLLRVWVSDSAELDESEQVLLTQEWRWGYGSDPPLYTWLQILAFQMFGVNILALALVKNLLLFSTFFFTYRAVRAMEGEERWALLAVLSLLLFPQITWESQRDLTHSVLATALSAATFWVAVRLSQARRVMDYILLGICLGLGALSKYSYGLVALALGAAAITIPRYRRALANKWILLTFCSAIAIAAFHFYWVVVTPEIALRRPAQVISNAGGGLIYTRAVGLWSVIKCTLMLGGSLCLAYWFAFAGFRRMQLSGECDDAQHWIGRTLLMVGTMAVMVVLALGIELKDRWFQPITFLGAIWAAWLVRDHLTGQVENRLCGVVVSVAALALILLPGIPLAASITKRPTRLNAPYRVLSHELEGSVGKVGVIVASTRLVGGNLRLHFPATPVVSPEFSDVTLSTKVPWLVVWDASKTTQLPAALARLTHTLRGLEIGERVPSYVETNCKYTRSKTMRLGYVLLPEVL